jgi:hypothetical protein
VLVAAGPHFARAFVDPYPSANVDVAPTVAALLGFSLPAADGRVLDEAFRGSSPRYEVSASVERTEPLRLRRSCAAHDPVCAKPKPAPRYSLALSMKSLRGQHGEVRTYVESAKVTR